MPSQQIFLSKKRDHSTLRVLKTYDVSFAREAFEEMDDKAILHLVSALLAEGHFEPEDVPESILEHPDFIWSQVLELARERDSNLSFFVVTRVFRQERSLLYVSPDWPTAESFVEDTAA